MESLDGRWALGHLYDHHRHHGYRLCLTCLESLESWHLDLQEPFQVPCTCRSSKYFKFTSLTCPKVHVLTGQLVPSLVFTWKETQYILGTSLVCAI